MYLSLAGLVAVLGAVVFVPLPHRVHCTLEIQPREAKAVYVDVPDGGRIEEALVDVPGKGRLRVPAEPGRRVAAGEVVGVLRNVDLDLKVAQLEGQLKQYEAKLRGLEQQRFRNPRAGAELPELRKACAALGEQLAKKHAERERLTLRAPVAGVVLPPPVTPRRDSPDAQLPGWSGTPLDKENLGAHLADGTLFCLIGDPTKHEAILVIDQSDVDLVGPGQRVEILLDEYPHQRFARNLLAAPEGKTERQALVIQEVANEDLKIAPQRLSTKAQGALPTETDPVSGVERPRTTVYQARVPIDAPEGMLRIGLRGQARVYVGWTPLGKRLWRLVQHTFNFRL